MAKAIWNGIVLAESDKTVIVEGNYYFPIQAVKQEYLRHSNTHTTCPWKGTANYYSINVNGLENRDGAWYYPNPKSAATQITNHIAFWRGVRIEL